MSRLSLHMAYWAVISALFSVVFSSALANAYGAVNTLSVLRPLSTLGIVASVVARLRCGRVCPWMFFPARCLASQVVC